jgi:hypothetical protein|tara:strand:+ start:3422 stop:3607 length:186 start_codon:yes stop_codon:yes gene_type:complete
MAAGDFSLINHGTFALSGADIATAVGNVNIPHATISSGAGLYIIGNGLGDATVLEVNVAAA